MSGQFLNRTMFSSVCSEKFMKLFQTLQNKLFDINAVFLYKVVPRLLPGN